MGQGQDNGTVLGQGIFKGVPLESIENTSFAVYWDNRDNKIL